MRFDFARFGKVSKTGSGGLRIPANLTRTGVFTYRRADGSIVKELRHPSEVFSPESLSTLADAVLTDLHPGKVTPAEYKQVSIGHVSGAAKQDGKFVAATVVVSDANAIAAVERGDRAELSCGYTCDVEVQSGVYDGERYDAVQKNIRYNHVALGPRNWGRAGPDVSLHLDSEDAIQLLHEDTIVSKETSVDYEKLYNELKAEAAKMSARLDAAEARATQAEKDRDQATGERDAARADAKAANDQARFDSAVAERVSLISRAKAFLGADFKADGKSDRELMVESILKTDSEFKAEGKSDEYVRGRFEALKPAAETSAVTKVAALFSGAPKEDSDDYETIDQIRAKARERSENAWQESMNRNRKDA